MHKWRLSESRFLSVSQTKCIGTKLLRWPPTQLTHTHANTPKPHLVPPPSEQNPHTHRITWGQWASQVTTVTGQEGVVGRSSCYIRLIQILIIPPPSSPSPHTHYKTFLPPPSRFLLSAPSSSPPNFACCSRSLPASLFSPSYSLQAFSLPPFSPSSSSSQ